MNTQLINEQLEQQICVLEYCDSKTHLANGFAKRISGLEWQDTVQQLCILPNP
jgi:hypothetical protein